MSVKANHQPRLYIEGSKFLLFKNGLPFLPDKLELSDSLQVIRGSNSSFQFSLIDNDLPVPEGTYHQLNNYQPVQYCLPLTYGLSKEGLPQNASDQRRAQAKQLKAFLLVFEQIMVNYLEQLSHVKDLFSLDKTISRTYFSRFLDEADIDVGAEFEEDIREFLDKASELLVLFTPWAFERPYVWAEIGAAWIRRIPIVVVLYGLTLKEFQSHPNAPVFLKKRDMISLNDIDQYFNQLERRVNNAGGRNEE